MNVHHKSKINTSKTVWQQTSISTVRSCGGAPVCRLFVCELKSFLLLNHYFHKKINTLNHSELCVVNAEIKKLQIA